MAQLVSEVRPAAPPPQPSRPNYFNIAPSPSATPLSDLLPLPMTRNRTHPPSRLQLIDPKCSPGTSGPRFMIPHAPQPAHNALLSKPKGGTGVVVGELPNLKLKLVDRSNARH